MMWLRRAMGMQDMEQPLPVQRQTTDIEARFRPPVSPIENNPVGWSSTYAPEVATNASPTFSPMASALMMTPEQKLGRFWNVATKQAKQAYTNADLPQLSNAGREAYDAAAGFVNMAAPVKPVRAYHATYEPFEKYDWSRLGQVTQENASGMSHEVWANNLAKIGPWAHERALKTELAAPHALPVELGGKGKSFQSLDALEKAVRKAGGSEQFRAQMIEQGYGHLAVKDAEFGGKSFIGLSPDTFKIIPE